MAERPSPAAGTAASRVVAACLVATLAFWAYTATLLPGVDLGDTGGFQAAVLWPAVSARQSYPLYYGMAKPFVSALSPSDPARGLNLFSAVWGATAIGLLVYATAAMTNATSAGVIAGLLLAFSYTFWTQAIIAEVYTLHLALIGACLIALHAYASRPGTGRLAIFFAVYALSFGNHFSMILFLAPFAVLLLLATPAPRELWRPRTVVMALAIAAAGALQYWPNLWNVVTFPDAPTGWRDTLAAFWFDVTKADWREQMVLGIDGNQVLDRLAMWWFDARQQFGVPGLLLAGAGVAALWRHSRVWGLTLTLALAISTVFALTYNVGDTHVFFLPSHFLTALFAGASILWLSRKDRSFVPFVIFVSFAVSYGAWRGWSTWPAVDRHDDRRGEQLIARLTLGVSDPEAILVSAMNWQLENVLLYMGRHQRPDLTWTRMGDVLPHFPFFVDDQQTIGRSIVLTSEAAAQAVAAYGPFLSIVPDDTIPVRSMVDEAARVPRGMPYVLTLLTPPSEETLDTADLDAAIAALTGRREPLRRSQRFELLAGLAGERPAVHESSDRPFTRTFTILDEPFVVRMDSWLPFDTFRRAGFGHVLRGREHVQIIERGVNLVWLTRDGRPSAPVYAASLFAPKRRYRIAGSTGQDPAYARRFP